MTFNTYAVSKEQAIHVCLATQKQGEVIVWYEERQKRTTGSHFGKIINRCNSIEPKTIKNQILKSNEVLSQKYACIIRMGG